MLPNGEKFNREGIEAHELRKRFEAAAQKADAVKIIRISEARREAGWDE